MHPRQNPGYAYDFNRVRCELKTYYECHIHYPNITININAACKDS